MFFNNLELFTDPKTKHLLFLAWIGQKYIRSLIIFMKYVLRLVGCLQFLYWCEPYISPLFFYSIYLLFMFIKHSLHDYLISVSFTMYAFVNEVRIWDYMRAWQTTQGLRVENEALMILTHFFYRLLKVLTWLIAILKLSFISLAMLLNNLALFFTCLWSVTLITADIITSLLHQSLWICCSFI